MILINICQRYDLSKLVENFDQLKLTVIFKFCTNTLFFKNSKYQFLCIGSKHVNQYQRKEKFGEIQVHF